MSETRKLTGEPKMFANGYRWEMDESGMHRIVDDSGISGRWSAYRSPAISADGTHICFTEYFGGDLPVERLIRMEVVS